MQFEEYEIEAAKTDSARYCTTPSILYYILGICGEAGELSEKVKKCMRDKKGDFKNVHTLMEIQKEMGDVLWYLSRAANILGMSLEDVAHENILKLKSRKERNKIHGEGDDR